MISIVFAASSTLTVKTVRIGSYVVLARNAGALLALLYVLGFMLTKNASRIRQEFSLVQRTYRTKLLTDKELN